MKSEFIESLITAIPLLWNNILGIPTELIFIVLRLLWKATKWYVDYRKNESLHFFPLVSCISCKDLHQMQVYLHQMQTNSTICGRSFGLVPNRARIGSCSYSLGALLSKPAPFANDGYSRGLPLDVRYFHPIFFVPFA